MPATVLDGTKIAAQIRSEAAAEVRQLSAGGIRPGLAVVLAGHDAASAIYVRGKVKACDEVGLYSEQHTPPDSVTTEDLLALVASLNRRDEIDGILVQLPLPAQVDAKRILLAVDPAKDVDGFHPMNVGLLSTQRPGLVPCTPAGCMAGRRRHWTQRHCGQAGRYAAAQCQRHGHSVPLEDPRPGRRLPPRRYFSRRHRTRWHGHPRFRQARRDCH